MPGNLEPIGDSPLFKVSQPLHSASFKPKIDKNFNLDKDQQKWSRIKSALTETAKSQNYDELLRQMLASLNSFEVNINELVADLYKAYAVEILNNSPNKTTQNNALRLYFELHTATKSFFGPDVKSKTMAEVMEEVIHNLRFQLKRDGCKTAIGEFEFLNVLLARDYGNPLYFQFSEKVARLEYEARTQENPGFLTSGLIHEENILRNIKDLAPEEKLQLKLGKLISRITLSSSEEVAKIVDECKELLTKTTASEKNFAAILPYYQKFLEKFEVRSTTKALSYDKVIEVDLLNSQFLEFARKSHAPEETQRELSLKTLNIYRNSRTYMSIPHSNQGTKEQSLLPKMLWIAYNYETDLPEVSPDRIFVSAKFKDKKTGQTQKATFYSANYHELLDLPFQDYSMSEVSGELGSNLEATILREVLLTQGRAEFEVALDRCRQKDGKQNKHEILEKKLKAPAPLFLSPQQLAEYAKQDVAMIREVQGNDVHINDMMVAQLAEVRENGGTPRIVIENGRKSIQITYPDTPKVAKKEAVPQDGWENSTFNKNAAWWMATGVGAVGVIAAYLWHNRNKPEMTVAEKLRRARRGLQEDATVANEERDRDAAARATQREKEKRDEEAARKVAEEILDLNKKIAELNKKLTPLKTVSQQKKLHLKSCAQPRKYHLLSAINMFMPILILQISAREISKEL